MLSATGAGLTACNPPIAPGATGVITVGSGVDTGSFATLVRYAFADESMAAFDPGQPLPLNSGAGPKWETLADVAFPFTYWVGGGSVGSSEVPTWTFVAWLSRRQQSRDIGLDPGDVYCAVPFRLRPCGSDYCDVTPGVDCVLADTVEAP